ncbi:hypothetical protein BKA70DRAFT_1206288 [Coprinopsis sp. MPI-PUGE-AT-0042]|nr:hypothetical protein BKA70DRAFT_1206288 [Coprinopsis sp. MPI-PUGE-AT-0042]
MGDTTKRNTLFYWDTIVIKVEDEIFRVPKDDFGTNSEVFADMFVMPSGDDHKLEGRDDDRPIFLEGYKKKDFICLLKVMYPSSRTLLAGTATVMNVRLDKEEWISVLNLATRWDMKMIRKYAIHQLSSTFEIPPVEKILLARAHKVAKWLEEGMTSLVEGTPKEIEELSALNCWETNARILSMTLTHTINSTKLSPPQFLLEQLKCTSCKKAMFTSSNCCGCSRSLSTGHSLKLTSTTLSSEGIHNGYITQIRCQFCNNHPWSNGSRFYCQGGCGTYLIMGTSYTQAMLVDFGAQKKLSVKEMVDKHFGEEVKEYRITWPDS